MKRFTLLLLVIAALLSFSSCSDDDEDFSIVGTWGIDKIDAANLKSNNGKYDKLIKNSLSDYDFSDIPGFMTFDEDGTWYDSDSAYGSYTVANGKVTATLEGYTGYGYGGGYGGDGGYGDYEGETLVFTISGSRMYVDYTLGAEELAEINEAFTDGYQIISLSAKVYFKKK